MSDAKTPAELGRALRKIAALIDEFGSLRSSDGAVQTAMRQAADMLAAQAQAEPVRQPLTDAECDRIIDAERWDTLAGRRAIVRRAHGITSKPSARPVASLYDETDVLPRDGGPR